ncbi:MAG: hypothetical protein LBP82_04330 [Candidatus Methanoplasma sp.]|jgi:hypothetical protein|nr:hypothetical protein [Candidatus Methanoplasma sp.]
MNNRTLSAVTVGAFIISLAIGLIVYAVTDLGFTIILWTAMLIFGIVLFAMSFMYPGASGKFGPSGSSYAMVMGILVAVIGLVGMLYTFTDLSVWILIAIFLIALAAVGISVALMNGKKEGQ